MHFDEPEHTLFHEPVDGNEYPTYHRIVKIPIDLSVIQERVEREFFYLNADHFLDDFALMRDNAIKFNDEGIIGDIAGAMYAFVERQVDLKRNQFDRIDEILTR